MKSHGVWTERPIQRGDHPIPSTWAYRSKLGPDNSIIERKARIRAQGFRQVHGLNFEESFAPTGKPASLRLPISHAAHHDLRIHQLDVRSAFLTCSLSVKVVLLPPPGYLDKANIFLELHKAIYGLKQSALVWYKRLSSFLT